MARRSKSSARSWARLNAELPTVTWCVRTAERGHSESVPVRRKCRRSPVVTFCCFAPVRRGTSASSLVFGRSVAPGVHDRLNRPITRHPAHRRVAAQSLGVVHVLIAGQPPEYRL